MFDNNKNTPNKLCTFVGVTIVTLACSMNVQARDGETVKSTLTLDFASATLGGNTLRAETFDDQGVSSGVTNSTFSYTNSSDFTIGYGSTDDNSRILLELSQSKNDIDENTAAELTVTSLLYSGYWLPKMPFLEVPRFHFLLGAGIGYSKVALAGVATSKLTDEVFTYKISAGAEYQIGSQMVVTLKYEVVEYDDMKDKLNSTDAAISNTKYRLGGFDASRASLGISYYY